MKSLPPRWCFRAPTGCILAARCAGSREASSATSRSRARPEWSLLHSWHSMEFENPGGGCSPPPLPSQAKPFTAMAGKGSLAALALVIALAFLHTHFQNIGHPVPPTILVVGAGAALLVLVAGLGLGLAALAGGLGS